MMSREMDQSGNPITVEHWFIWAEQKIKVKAGEKTCYSKDYIKSKNTKMIIEKIATNTGLIHRKAFS